MSKFTASFMRQLDELERQIGSRENGHYWIDGRENIVRVDIDGRRGKPHTFKNPCQLREWLEPVMDRHSGGIIIYSLENLADLHENADDLKAAIKILLPHEIIIPEDEGQGGHSFVYSTEHLPGFLPMLGVTSGQKADLRTWCLWELTQHYFETPAVYRRIACSAPSDDDVCMTNTLLMLYCWPERLKPSEVIDDFSKFVLQAAHYNDVDRHRPYFMTEIDQELVKDSC